MRINVLKKYLTILIYDNNNIYYKCNILKFYD